MDFRFGDDQLLFQSTVRDFLAKECTPEVVRALWAERDARARRELWTEARRARRRRACSCRRRTAASA